MVLVLAVICGIAPGIRHTVCLHLIRLATHTKFPESHAKSGGSPCDTTETKRKSELSQRPSRAGFREYELP